MKCSVKDCETVLELDLSFILKICRWCRKQFEEDWDEDDWFNHHVEEYEDPIKHSVDDS
jgi:hypothetical protein